MCKKAAFFLGFALIAGVHTVALAQTQDEANPAKTGQNDLPEKSAAEEQGAEDSGKSDASSESTPASTQGGVPSEPAVQSADAPEEPNKMSAGTYAVRLRDLEQRINELKEQIFRSKARLSLLAETVLQGVVAGSQSVIVHENRMSSSYQLVKAVYSLDGAPIFNKADEEGGLGDKEKFEIYHGSIVPGEHTLTVNLEYRGHGFGIFSYLKGYRFKVRSTHTFTAPEGKAVTVRIVAYEKGGPTAPLEDRPAIRFVERIASARLGTDGTTGAKGGE
ncbi:MAG: hypothetical protein IPJ88_13695 [Myxococcales bacterium]|nr:MAG: hypothetical protein IPJ88_13695 [Myxococcales bacterium]